MIYTSPFPGRGDFTDLMGRASRAEAAEGSEADLSKSRTQARDDVGGPFCF
jgi:hypothetical protein